ncbi:glycerophosphodiester phosphodiesterase [Ligilactobacillus murinus]|uniref:Glycerophosphodiester phosphodiesterase n=1 Tax=Ligilactobacillus murinus TaxID=1622 RepID=A0AAD0KZZ5_9LACO|nr:glycerophosphodiester phosphodiesterase [Ligilactobacillus murinus]AWZ38354.1 glycerophosphodiester phosphodiesterase [Ligilactobacillus murinus]AWZ40657.1 glycerophosphodiester phosphodiesterase [Ligilactobacillus murinus]MBX9011537.1 glycerophosphodiester phosphodiesterase [Ligilactobacillus murinus]HCM78995.1 glycerophosphodiester phosphodiesterase [Lactobacillus sp.]
MKKLDQNLVILGCIIVFLNSLMLRWPLFSLLSLILLPLLAPTLTKQTDKNYFAKLFYIVILVFLWLPFSALSFSLERLNQVALSLSLSAWIFTYRQLILGIGSMLFLVLYYLALRSFLGIVPYFTTSASFKETLKQSFSKTKHHIWHYAKYIILGGISLLLVDLLGLWATTLVTTPRIAVLYAVSFWTLKQVLVLSLVFWSVKSELPKRLAVVLPAKWKKWGAGVLVLLALGIQVNLAHKALNVDPGTLPLVISHRGVDGKNGVQNTLPALNKTKHAAKPAYVELDIQETADRRFVVSHDEDLRKLAHKNLVIADNSLEQLTQVKLKENGHVAYVASFDSYLKQAQKLKQPLLVELKVNQGTGEKFSAYFCEVYGRKLTKKDAVHSMDLSAINELKQRIPKMQAGYILPFNLFSLAENKADFYSLEYKTATKNFIKTAHANGKKVYLWTVNSPQQALMAWVLGADGVITDEPSKVEKSLADHSSKTYLKANLKLYLKEMI